MSSAPSLLLPHDYARDAAKEIRKAKKRIAFLAMVAFDDDSSSELFSAMAEAAARGVKVDVMADIFTFTESGETIFPIRYYDRKTSRAEATRKKLLKSGAKFRWLGRSHMTIFSGRTHDKWCVVDDIAYTFGGVNFFSAGLANNDYMLKIHDNRIADAIVGEHKRIKRADVRDNAYRSYSVESTLGTMLFDGGLIGESIIYRHATALANLASKVTIVSQYCPTGKIAKALRQPGKNVELYFNPPENAPFVNKVLIKIGMRTTRLTTLYNKSQYLHAKFAIFELPDGSKIAITGSHNLNWNGVLFGTREVALETKDPVIIGELEKFLHNQVKIK